MYSFIFAMIRPWSFRSRVWSLEMKSIPKSKSRHKSSRLLADTQGIAFQVMGSCCICLCLTLAWIEQWRADEPTRHHIALTTITICVFSTHCWTPVSTPTNKTIIGARCKWGMTLLRITQMPCSITGILELEMVVYVHHSKCMDHRD
jgi:hypothetical protein